MYILYVHMYVCTYVRVYVCSLTIILIVAGYVLDGIPLTDSEWMSPGHQMAWLFGSQWKPDIIINIKVCVICLSFTIPLYLLSIYIRTYVFTVYEYLRTYVL